MGRRRRTIVVACLGLGAAAVLAAAVWASRERIVEEWRRWRLRDSPSIEAVVQKVGQGLAVLSVGRDRNVREGQLFTVHRDGRFVAKLKVIKVYEDLAGARVTSTQEGESIRPGDKATTRP